jgi:uncharacterized membrane protein HdeD (DUF308 family)
MNESSVAQSKTTGAVWYYIGGILSVIVGFAAITAPYLFSALVAQFIGIFCVVSGVFLLFSAIFGKTQNHRVLDFFSAILRLVVGLTLLANLVAAVMALTLLLACIFLAEGMVGVFYAFKLKGKNSAWVWILLNGVVALILGGMLLAKFPSDAPWAVGLLFGINSIFLGFSLIMFASALPNAKES